MARVIFEPARPADVQVISAVTLSELNLAYRPPGLLAKSILQKNILVCRDLGNRQLVGWIEKFNLVGNIWGVSTLYVFPQYRRFGRGRQLIQKICASLNSRTIYTATTSAYPGKVLVRLGFRSVERKSIPKIVFCFWILKRYYHPRTWVKYLNGTISGLTYLVRAA